MTTTIVDASDALPTCIYTTKSAEELASEPCWLILAKPPGTARGSVVLTFEPFSAAGFCVGCGRTRNEIELESPGSLPDEDVPDEDEDEESEGDHG